ncbi:MAG: alpha/beta fold hydrolase [Candidatus Goldbacteria bacterium]|nr:alpha/beta fold hydrolase [Candidatus Goldiibacteriota bacterium]
MSKKKLLITSFFIILFVFITYIINETPFMYSTPIEYKLPDYSKINPDYRPIKINNKKSDKIIIFLHGFKATPLQFKELAEYFSKKYNVLVPLYPGHGTNKEDFKKTYFSQWYKHVRDIYLEARKNYKKVYLCGLSMGGTIALKLAEEFCCDNLTPDCVISISAPVFLNNLKEGIIYDWRLYIDRYISWFIKELKNRPNKADKDGAINDMPPDYELYDFPVQVHSLKMGMYETGKKLKLIKTPILLMHANGDATVPFQNMSYIRKNLSSGTIRVREFDLSSWKHTKHILINYNSTKKEVRKEIEEFINSLN